MRIRIKFSKNMPEAVVAMSVYDTDIYAIERLMRGLLGSQNLEHPRLGDKILSHIRETALGSIKVNGHGGFTYRTDSGRVVRYIPPPEGPKIQIRFCAKHNKPSTQLAKACLRHLTGQDIRLDSQAIQRHGMNGYL